MKAYIKPELAIAEMRPEESMSAVSSCEMSPSEDYDAHGCDPYYY